MELTGALSNLENGAQLDWIRKSKARIKVSVSMIMRTKPLRPGPIPILKTVLGVLGGADGGMHIGEIHADCGAALGVTVSRQSLQDCLSDHARGSTPSLRRAQAGWYRRP